MTTILTLDNGMRVAVAPQPGNVTYCGIFIDAGSRDEPSSLPGLAHFVEHTIFKGTSHRSSWHISNRMESVGGELNAYTTKESTCVYITGPAGYEEREIELLADLVANATFPSHEIDKEREVIVEEINSYLDNPTERVFDEFEDLFFAGSSLAHNILGTPRSVREIAGADCRSFLQSHYSPGRMVGYIAGPVNPERVSRLLRKHWGRFDRPAHDSGRTAPAPVKPFEIVRDNGGHQAHTILGFPMFPRTDSRRFPLMLLNNYLGGPCMNSRLNQQLRDKRGLVYTVDSYVSLLSDTGMMSIYFGSDPKTVKKCVRLIRQEIDALLQNTLSDRKLDRIKEQYCGQLLIGSDNKEAMALSLPKNLMYFNRLTDIRELAARLREVSPAELREVAELLAPAFSSQLTLM